MKTNGRNGKSNGGSTKPLASEPAKDSAINWDDVHQRILEGTAKLAWMEEELPQEVLEQSWARRATQIAHAIEAEDSGEQVELALVRLGYEIFGLDVRYVYEIRALDHITRVPRVPEWVAGVVNLRGRIISALDLKRFLGLPASAQGAAESTAPPHLVVVEIPEMELALVVDEVLSIETLPASQIQETSSAIRGIRTEYVRGVFVRPDADQQQKDNLYAREENHLEEEPRLSETNLNLLMILDLPALLSDKRLVIREEVL